MSRHKKKKYEIKTTQSYWAYFLWIIPISIFLVLSIPAIRIIINKKKLNIQDNKSSTFFSNSFYNKSAYTAKQTENYKAALGEVNNESIPDNIKKGVKNMFARLYGQAEYV